MKASAPISIELPRGGVRFAESVHAADFQMPERTDRYHKVLYVLAGSVRLEVRGAPPVDQVEANSVLVLPRRTPHRLIDREPSTLLLLCIDQGFIASHPDLVAIWNELQRLPERYARLDRVQRHRLENLWRHALLESAQSRLGASVLLRTFAAQLLVLLARLPPLDTRDEAVGRVRAVADEIRETFFDAWSLDQAARRAGLSRRQFSEVFRRLNGSSFGEYLTEIRLVHAARLLRDPAASVAGVTFSCGFNDVSHFYRLFRRRFGAPPRAWAMTGHPERSGPPAA